MNLFHSHKYYLCEMRYCICEEPSPAAAPCSVPPLCRCYGCRRPGPQLSPPPTRRWWSWPPHVSLCCRQGDHGGTEYWPPRYYRLSVGMPSIAAYAYSFHTSIPYHIHRDENVTVTLPLQSNKFLWKIFEILNVLTFLHKFIVTFYRLFPATYGLFRKQVFVAETQQRRTKRSVFGSDWSYLSIWRLVSCVGSPWSWSGSFSKKYWILLSRISRSLPSPGWSRGCWWLN